MSIAELRERVALMRNLPPPERRRELREGRVSLREIADALGVSPSAVAFWESGERTPRGENLAKYLEVLRILEEAGP